MKTLTNPTDEQLNAAFAEKIAGWTQTVQSHVWWNKHAQCQVANFTTSADAVLPWLEKWREGDPDYRACTMSLSSDGRYHVELRGFDEPNQYAKHAILAKAIVAVLLRAHGVEIEFTS